MIGLPKFLTGYPAQRRRISTIFLVVSIALALPRIYLCRYQLNPDAMDYLDISRQVASGNWRVAANGYWGTLQAVLLSPVFLFHPTAAKELPIAHFYSIWILLAAFFSFRWFLNACLDSITANDYPATRSLPEWALCLLAYALFLWTSLEVVSVEIIGPDLLVTAFIYLAAAVLLGLKHDSSVSKFLAFGLILGVGYWVKAIMFPIALVFLFVAFFKAPFWKRNLASVLAFAVVAAPLVAALSLPRGRFTFGDSGRLNYTAYVSPGGNLMNWQGAPPGSGTPKHPTRKITGPVPIYEFNGPLTATYPPSYDPSYWNEGHKWTFNLRSQLSIIAQHIPTVVELSLVAQPAVTAAFLFLLFWNPQGFASLFVRRWHLLFISGAMIGLYMLVHLETRFIGAFVVLIWTSAFFALRAPSDESSQRLAGLSIAAVVCVMLLSLFGNVARRFVNGCEGSALPDVVVAQHLNLQPGTPVAVVGPGNFAYWAHLAQLRIVAEIMGTDEADFWRLTGEKREELNASFRATGAQWLIAQPPGILIDQLDPGWQQIGATTYYRYPLAEER
jgi:hypothetical protein